MAYFPFFIDISDKVCIVVGGGRIAFRKIEVLSKFNAKIIVIASNICEEICLLKEVSEQIVLNKRDFLDEDILQAEFVIAATDDESLNSHISGLCKKNSILVNVVDVKEECSFVFPAIVKKEELVIAISTGGNSPAMAAKIKKDIQRVIPDYYGELISILGEYREYIKNEINDIENRKEIYNELIHIAELNKENITFESIQDIVKKYK